MSRLNQDKARNQLRRGSLVPRYGGYIYPNGSIVWFDEVQRLSELLSQLGWAARADRSHINPYARQEADDARD